MLDNHASFSLRSRSCVDVDPRDKPEDDKLRSSEDDNYIWQRMTREC